MTTKNKRRSFKEIKQNDEEDIEDNECLSMLLQRIIKYAFTALKTIASSIVWIITGLLIFINENPFSRRHRLKKNKNIKIQFKSSLLIENLLIGPRKNLNLVLDLEGTLMRANVKPNK